MASEFEKLRQFSEMVPHMKIGVVLNKLISDLNKVFIVLQTKESHSLRPAALLLPMRPLLLRSATQVSSPGQGLPLGSGDYPNGTFTR